MDPKKIEAVKEWPAIKSIKQLHAFLGLTRYYQQFIKDYAKITLPLTKLLKNEVVFEWTDAQEEAKQKLITMLITGPILTKPDLEKPLILATDASDKALSTVLSQDGKLISFLSKTFSGAEINWDIYKKELYAGIYAMEKWEYWLRSNVQFTWITDNRAVSHIRNQPKLTPKQAQWIQFLEDLNLKMEFCEGADNKVADTLSHKDIFGITVVNNQHWLNRIRSLTTKLELPKGM
jgi:hypothetical protein